MVRFSQGDARWLLAVGRAFGFWRLVGFQGNGSSDDVRHFGRDLFLSSSPEGAAHLGEVVADAFLGRLHGGQPGGMLAGLRLR
jgi:hypothetical protein